MYISVCPIIASLNAKNNRIFERNCRKPVNIFEVHMRGVLSVGKGAVHIFSLNNWINSHHIFYFFANYINWYPPNILLLSGVLHWSCTNFWHLFCVWNLKLYTNKWSLTWFTADDGRFCYHSSTTGIVYLY